MMKREEAREVLAGLEDDDLRECILLAEVAAVILAERAPSPPEKELSMWERRVQNMSEDAARLEARRKEQEEQSAARREAARESQWMYHAPKDS